MIWVAIGSFLYGTYQLVVGLIEFTITMIRLLFETIAIINEKRKAQR
jgi:hypothetical protein